MSPPRGIRVRDDGTPPSCRGCERCRGAGPLVGTGASVLSVLLWCQSGRSLAHGVGGVISICAAWLPNIGLTTFTTVP